MTTVAVLIACHNRRLTTIQCLRALFQCRSPSAMQLDVLLLDDGSTDRTADAVAEEFPSVTILRGDGTLFWNRSMHQLFTEATRRNCDYFLWLNDDTVLAVDALERLFAVDAMVRDTWGRPGIIVGSTRDPASNQLNYGGGMFVRPRDWLHTTIVDVTTVPIACETMTGNCALVPREVATLVGNLDWAFEHGLGDYDYGLRARKLGVSLWSAGVIGACRSHAFTDLSERSLRSRLSWIMARNQLPPRSWARFTRRHAGLGWPIFFVLPYFKVAVGPWLIRVGLRPPYSERSGHRPT